MAPPRPLSAGAQRYLPCLADLERYSGRVVGLPLRPYQLEAGRAIVAAALGRAPRDLIVVIMARQAGKNELSAQLEAYLLALHCRRGGTIVKCAPTFHPQLYTSMQRLSDRGNNALTTVRGRLGFVLEVGRARVQFLSAAPGAQVVGATASIALEVDEAQDCDEEKLTRDFYPMLAATNAPRVYYGTAWAETDPLQRAKQTARALERRDGVRRGPRALARRAAELLPEGRAAAWNQAMMELGATVCRPRRPACDVCPVRPGCGGPDALPAAAVRPGARQRFEATDRWARGRLLAALVAGDAPPELAAERRERALAGLERDGLVLRGPGGEPRLP